MDNIINFIDLFVYPRHSLYSIQTTAIHQKSSSKSKIGERQSVTEKRSELTKRECRFLNCYPRSPPLHPNLQTPIALSEDVHHMVEPNTTLRRVAINLMDKKLLNYPTAFLWVNLARWQKRAHKIKAGEYLINVGISNKF
ncbi:endolytic transglycosylase MltG [Candidatus Marithrix sp. Canyon 246]|uniref:endolytic transglycosylase MltG n=1 Tax=Candidatus Marithrix sp. Canyon 246 TaxID=1827136 RepID=UPI00114CF2E9|nr:endolytic transglycosylase MltG [Candidatus Marithrix sp. Canyon 246]